jgi:anti-anti-sigma factor
MEIESNGFSAIIPEIKSIGDGLISRIDNASALQDQREKDLIIESQNKRIADLEEEVEVLRSQIDILIYNNISSLQSSQNQLNFNTPVYYVKFGQKNNTKCEFTKQINDIESPRKKEEFSHYAKEGITIVSVNLLRATMEHAISFRDYLNSIVLDNSNLIIDLSECTFLDSTFLGVLVSSLKNTLRSNGDIRIVLNEDTESIIFYMTRLDRLFKIFNNLEDAISSYDNER